MCLRERANDPLEYVGKCRERYRMVTAYSIFLAPNMYSWRKRAISVRLSGILKASLDIVGETEEEVQEKNRESVKE